MTVVFYLEVSNGHKFQWVNHTVTKKSEIEWLLMEVKDTMEKALDNQAEVLTVKKTRRRIQ